MDKGLKKDVEKAKEKIEGKVERGAEKVKKAWDDTKHDVKIKISEEKEMIKDKLHPKEDKKKK